ncbi:MAG: hypothetical protein VKL41_08940, partial [Snowella sp.]|nr:hypothetical protein [Snowella sp.]
NEAAATILWGLPHGTIVRCQDYSLNKTNNRNLSHHNEEGFCFSIPQNKLFLIQKSSQVF